MKTTRLDAKCDWIPKNSTLAKHPVRVLVGHETDIQHVHQEIDGFNQLSYRRFLGYASTTGMDYLSVIC